MAIKTYNKPNRTQPYPLRYFKQCDAARVAREVIKRDPQSTPEQVLACVAKGLGFTHISLSRTTSVEASILPAVIRNLPVLVEKALTLLRALVKKYGWLLPFVKDLLNLLEKIKKIVDDILRLTEPRQERVDDVIDGEKCKCKKTSSK